MKINNNNGHTLTGLGTGAIGYLNESQETRNIGYYFVDGMKKLGHTVYDCTIDKSNTYLYEAVSKANTNKADLASCRLHIFGIFRHACGCAIC